MTVIQVPRPPKEAMNPNRPANTLLMWQVEHMHAAEKRLPARYHTDIYVNAIRTEAEAANYIRQVTEAIHRAHKDAARGGTGRPKTATVLQLAAAAEDKPPRKRTSTSKHNQGKGNSAPKT